MFSQTYSGRHKKIGVAQHTCGTRSQTRKRSVSGFSSHTGDLCPFHSLFSATVFAFLLVISPFKIAPKPSVKLLFSVPKRKKTDVPHRENVCEMNFLEAWVTASSTPLSLSFLIWNKRIVSALKNYYKDYMGWLVKVPWEVDAKLELNSVNLFRWEICLMVKQFLFGVMKKWK